MNNGLDIKNINSEQMLFFTLQEIKNSVNKLDNRIDKLDDKIEKQGSEFRSIIDRNFLWTLGIMITGFIGLAAIILSKL